MRITGIIFAVNMAILTVMAAGGVYAQTAEPTLEIQFEETEVVPGQPLTLRLTVLVPTFMPSPPEWPTFETPNLLVRLPSKASSPTSKKINGETWSGITRRYQISPIVPGDFVVPQSEVRVHYRGETDDEVITSVLPVPAFQLSGIVPEGAETMDPFLAAHGLTLTQQVTGETETLSAGGSFAREVVVSVQGVSPMFVPQVTQDSDVAGLKAYPESPVLDEKDNRGVSSGVRTEKTVYVAEAAVDGALAEVQLQWFNLDTGTLEVATLPQVVVLAQAPDGPSVGAGAGLHVLRYWPWAVGVLGIGAVAFAYWRWVRGPVARWRARRHVAWLGSENCAWRAVRHAVGLKDLPATRVAIDVWRARLPAAQMAADAAVQAALIALGRPQFQSFERARVDRAGGADEDWRSLDAHLRGMRRAARYHHRKSAVDLPQLNPTHLSS